MSGSGLNLQSARYVSATMALFTAHCNFSVTITKVASAEEALGVFEKLDVVVLKWSNDSNEPVKATNWKGVDFCPAVRESPGGYASSDSDKFQIYAYIKVFLEASDIGHARQQLNQLCPEVDEGKPFWDRTNYRSSRWDFSIDPSVGEDLDPQNRTALTGSAAKVWQKAPQIAAEDRIAPSDPPLEAARKATRQFKRALQPFELCWILKANGIDLSKEGAWQEAAWEISEQLAKNG